MQRFTPHTISTGAHTSKEIAQVLARPSTLAQHQRNPKSPQSSGTLGTAKCAPRGLTAASIPLRLSQQHTGSAAKTTIMSQSGRISLHVSTNSPKIRLCIGPCSCTPCTMTTCISSFRDVARAWRQMCRLGRCDEPLGKPAAARLRMGRGRLAAVIGNA